MNPTLVILAAGMSSRYGRLKQLEPLGPGGEALLDYSVFDAKRAGFRRVVLVIRPELEERFRAHIQDRWPGDMETVFHHQRLDDVGYAGQELAEEARSILGSRSKPWGTGHALLSARDILQNAVFALLNADDFYGASAFEAASAFIGALPGARAGGNGDAEAVAGANEDAETVAGANGDAEALTGTSTDLGKEGPTPEFGLMTYALDSTLSPHGGVNRAVCRLDGRGGLTEITEVVDIRGEPGSVTGRTLDGIPIPLEGREPVSTNFWIFGPGIFPHLTEGFQAFLGTCLADGPPRPGAGTHAGSRSGSEREFLVPIEVNRLISLGKVRVSTIPVQGPFLGITHPEDRGWVAEGLLRLVQAGRYPRRLWL